MEAKRIARERLAEIPPKDLAMPKPGRESLAEMVSLYMTAPETCSKDSAKRKESVLKSVVPNEWGKSLEEAKAGDSNALWPFYVAAWQGLPRPDYSTRREINHSITSAIRQAASIFIPALRPHCAPNGIVIPENSTTIIWPSLGDREPVAARDGALIEAWERLRESDADLWVTVELARFAVLRQSEILACRGKWMRQAGALVYVNLKDRVADGYFEKTRRWYSALVLSNPLAEYLLALSSDSTLITHPGAHRWIKYEPQKWLRQFTGDAKAPPHRLRRLYADRVKRETKEAILSRPATMQEASEIWDTPRRRRRQRTI